MAEFNTNKHSVRPKPVLPPKPVCVTEGLREAHRPQRSIGVKVSPVGTGAVNSDRLLPKTYVPAPPSVKPPLLPKPVVTQFQIHSRNSKLDFVQPESSPKEGNGFFQQAKQKPPKLFIPNIDFFGSSNTGSSTRAPVAKLEEFDNFSDEKGPVRPPRSPKNRNFAGELLSPELRGTQGGNFDVNRYASLCGTSNCDSEVKFKSSSLGRSHFNDVKRMLESQGCLFKEESPPIPPPRRRNKSITDSPDILPDKSFTQIPEYSKVNYNLKKNRRVVEKLQENNTNGSATTKIITNEYSCSRDTVQDKNTCSFSKNCNTDANSRDCEVHEQSICNLPITAGGNSTGAINFNAEKLSMGSQPQLPRSHELTTEVILITEAESVTLEQASFEEPQKHLEVEMYSEGKLVPSTAQNSSEVCSELCCDCLSAQILEDSFDNSVSSSKLEWQSVRSSFTSNSSDGEMAQHLDLNLVGTLASSEQSIFKSGDSSNRSRLHGNSYDHCERFEKVHLVDSNKSQIKALSPHLEKWPSRQTRHFSSLPHYYKSSKRHQRRRSWNGSREFSWLDEGESSSGNLGDLDSSDNALHSLEEINVKKSNKGCVDRKFSWWLPVGECGRELRESGTNHHSFHSEYEDTSKFEDWPSKGNMFIPGRPVSVKSLPTPTSPLGTQHHGHEFRENNKSMQEKSFLSDIHSDSDGEETNSSCNIQETDKVTKNRYDEKKAFLIAKELMTSEHVFISVLRLLNVDFRQAVENSGSHKYSVISEVEFDKIFNSLPQLQRLNEELHKDLEERIENWSSHKKIADVIVKKGPFLKLYTTYIQNFESQCNYFDECSQKYPKFARVIREFEISPICHKLSIKHFMLKPVQRIPQYRLLLEDYFHHLHPSSPDFEDTQMALRIVSDVAEHANRSIKLGDHLSILLQLQSRLGNYEIIKPGRIVLKDGELYKLSRKEGQPRYFILLNDCLLYTSYYGSGPSSGLKVNCELPLGGMKVTTPQAEDYHNEFSIITSTRSFTLSARSSFERRQWVDALQSAIQECTSRQLSFQVQKLNIKRNVSSSEPFKIGKEAPVWIQDGRVTKCQSCVAEFTVTYRRHHCRACGKVVCGACSAFRAPLQYMKFQPDRVCEDCFTTLLTEFDEEREKMEGFIKQELRKCDKHAVQTIRSQFKRLGPSSGRKTKKHIPQRLLEVTANDGGSQMCGWLQRRMKRSWKRLWFVLKEQVLYVYKASEDVVALESIPVLGYKVEPMEQNHFQLYEGINAKLVFQLAHPNQQPLVFSADNENLVNRWITELQEAAVLK